MSRLSLAVAGLMAIGMLSGCKSPEERADRFVDAALVYLDESNTSAAILEIRNALQLLPQHETARRLLADLRREEGDLADATRHYLALVSAHPSNGAGHLALAEIALGTGDWSAVAHHGRQAEAFLGTTPEVRAVTVNLAYRKALSARDRRGAAQAVAEATLELRADPSRQSLRWILIDAAIRREDWQGARDEIELALAGEPTGFELHRLRLAVLKRIDPGQPVEDQLRRMVALFPDEPALSRQLVGHLLAAGEAAEAEGFLRDLATRSPARLDAQRLYLSYVRERRGADAALEELERLTGSDGGNSAALDAMAATLLFDEGRRREAVAALEDLLARHDDGDLRPGLADDIRTELARMLAATGQPGAAGEQLDAVLAQDPGHVAALKLRATLQIRSGASEEALLTLWNALRESPRDAQSLTLLAGLHDRAGARDLRREMLARAAEATGMAPPETVRYVRALVADGYRRQAEDVLVHAIRFHPDSVLLRGERDRVRLATAAELLAEGDIDAAIALHEALLEDHPDNLAMRNNLAVLLAGREDSTSLARAAWLAEPLAETASPEMRDTFGWIAARQGRFVEAEPHLAYAVAQRPEHPVLRYHLATTLANLGREAEALAEYRQAERLADPSLPQAEREIVRAEIARLEAVGDAPRATRGTGLNP